MHRQAAIRLGSPEFVLNCVRPVGGFKKCGWNPNTFRVQGKSVEIKYCEKSFQ